MFAINEYSFRNTLPDLSMGIKLNEKYPEFIKMNACKNFCIVNSETCFPASSTDKYEDSTNRNQVLIDSKKPAINNSVMMNRQLSNTIGRLFEKLATFKKSDKKPSFQNIWLPYA